MEGTIAEIRMFSGNFAPRAWAFCEGQLLSINSNQALFSLIGTIYGGDGRTTFALPDLRGRTNIGPGTGPGLPSYREGQRGGTYSTTLTTLNMPSHTHSASTVTNTVTAMNAAAAATNTSNPQNASLASGPFYENTIDPARPLSVDTAVSTSQSTTTIQPTGGQQAFNNMQPYLACYYIICLQGVFPSRS